MTTVRGKEPIALTHAPRVEAWTTSQQVIVRTGGYCGTREFSAEGKLSVTCARNLIIELRKALRSIRDETATRLNAAVAEAEKPL